MTTTESNLNNNRKEWDLDSFLHLSGYSLLGLSFIISLWAGLPDGSLAIFLTLSTLMALWYLPFVTTPIYRWLDAPKQSFFYFLVGFALWGGLVALNPVCLMLVAMFNPMIFTRFSIRWAIGVMVFLTAAFLPLYLVLYPSDNWPVIVLIVLGLMSIGISIGYFFPAISNFFAGKR